MIIITDEKDSFNESQISAYDTTSGILYIFMICYDAGVYVSAVGGKESVTWINEEALSFADQFIHQEILRRDRLSEFVSRMRKHYSE